MSGSLPRPVLALACRFALTQRAGAATEFALVGLWVIGLMMVILNLALLGFSLAALARGVQGAARQAVVSAAANDAADNTFTCPAAATIAGYFNRYAEPPLPAAGTTNASNPYITATWTNASSTSGAVYLTLVGTYTWSPMGFANLGSGIRLRISTVATVMGTTPSGSYKPSIDSSCQ